MNGQQQKTEVSNQKAQQGGREGRLIIRAKQSAKISLQPGGTTAALVIKNCVKQGDSVTFTLGPQSKQLRNVRVQSYLNDPSNGE